MPESMENGPIHVLGATAVMPTLTDAVDSAYRMVSRINFDGAYYRRDIGKKALKAVEEVR